MIDAQLLNSDASLNSWHHIQQVSYVPGENVRLVIQILKTDEGIRYIPPTAATLQITMINSDESELVKSMSKLFASDDRSIWYVDLSQAETEELASANLRLKLDVNGDGTLVYLTSMSNVLVRTTEAGECC